MGTSFTPRNTVRAKALRNAATPAERLLWQHVSRRQISGAKFSRQMPVGPYSVDFLCREAKLVIELDGYSHDLTIAPDAQRTAFIERAGYRVIRFTNADVMVNVEGVVTTIAQALQAHPQPLPQAGGEQNWFVPQAAREREGGSFRPAGGAARPGGRSPAGRSGVGN